MILLARLRDGDAIESYITMAAQGVEEIICHARVVRKVHIVSGSRYQFTSDI